MPDPFPETLALLWDALQNPATARRAVGRLRTVLIGLPHPRHRLPRLRLAGVIRSAAGKPDPKNY